MNAGAKAFTAAKREKANMSRAIGRDALRPGVQQALQNDVALMFYNRVSPAVVLRMPPREGSLMRALYDEHVAAIERGELRDIRGAP